MSSVVLCATAFGTQGPRGKPGPLGPRGPAGAARAVGPTGATCSARVSLASSNLPTPLTTEPQHVQLWLHADVSPTTAWPKTCWVIQQNQLTEVHPQPEVLVKPWAATWTW